MVSAKRDEQKQKVMNKRMQKTLDERKKENVFLERVFFKQKQKTEVFFFGKYKRVKNKQKVSLFAKILGLNGREWKKKKKRKILPGKFCEGEW